MKKNVFNRFAIMIIAATLTLTAANTFAATQPVKMNFKVHSDTPYMTQVHIIKTGFADTPYLKFNVQPILLNTQLNSLLGSQAGLFHVFIVYMNEEGEQLYEEDYYYGNGDNTDREIKYD